MSNLPSASSSPAAPAAPQPSPAPVSRTPLPNAGLPDSAKITPNSQHDASAFFEAHKAANQPPGAVPPSAAPVAPVAPVVAAPTPTPAPAEVPEKGSLAAKLAAKAKPAAAVATPVAPAAGANPEDQLVLDKSYSPAAHESFAKIKGIAGGLRDQLTLARENEKRLQLELEAARKAPAPVENTELERLRAENLRMSERLAITDLREHPEFQSRFIAPQQTALQEAQALLDANGGGLSVADLLNKPRAEFGKAVSEAASKMSAFDQTDFAQQMRTAYTLKQQGDQALSKSKEVYGSLQQQTAASQKQAFGRVWDSVYGQVSEHLVEIEAPDNATPEMQQAIENYNGGLRGLRTSAEKIAFEGVGAEHVAKNAIKAAAYDFHITQAMPKLMGEFQALLNLNRQMAEQLRAVRARNPNLSGSAPVGALAGGLGADGTLSNEQLSRMSHAEAAAALAPAR